MSDYKEIVGTRVKAVSANPDNPTVGQVWYNSTDEALKYRKANAAGAWSSGGNLNSGRDASGIFGTQTATIMFGGLLSDSHQVLTENYNGSSWTEVGDLNQNKAASAGAGTSTAGLSAGGDIPSGGPATANVESWNGSSWTEIGDMTTGREGGASTNSGTGNSRSALLAGGSLGSPVTAVTEEWTVPFVTKTIGTD